MRYVFQCIEPTGRAVERRKRAAPPGQGERPHVDSRRHQMRRPVTNRRSAVSLPRRRDTEQDPVGSRVVITGLTLLLAAVIVVVTGNTSGLADVIPLLVIAGAVSSRRQR
jgi:hypothetical protein